jgi:hypothetical protein
MFAIGKYKRGIAAALVAVALAACDDDTTDPTDEPQFTTMRLTVGAQTINVNKSCVVTGGPIVIGTSNTAFGAQFLLANGSADPIVNTTDFRLDVTVSNTGLLTFVSAAGFTGSFTRITTGSTSVLVELIHIEEQHDEISCTIPVTVQ